MLFANQAAVAIQNARQVKELRRLHEERLATERLNAQLETAKAVQSGLLPLRPPEMPGWDMAFRWRPALQIGGDFYDSIDLGGGNWGVVIGDVADKGIPAAIYMSLALSMIRAPAAGKSDPEQVLLGSNHWLVSGSHSGIFVTVLYGIIRSDDHTITLCSAGHNPMLVRRAKAGTVEEVQAGGIVLGVERSPQFNRSVVSLEAGDVAVLYTDGVTEAMNAAGVPFGQDQLEAFHGSNLPDSAQGVVEARDVAIAAHTVDAEQSDDITHIVIRAMA